LRLSEALRLSMPADALRASGECDVSSPLDASAGWYPAASAISGFISSASLLILFFSKPLHTLPARHCSCAAISKPGSGVMQVTS
jgi:hypothetical protein